MKLTINTLIKQKALDKASKLFNYMGKEKAFNYLSQFKLLYGKNIDDIELEDCYIYSQYGLDVRCMIHFDEACAIIDAFHDEYVKLEQSGLQPSFEQYFSQYMGKDEIVEYSAIWDDVLAYLSPHFELTFKQLFIDDDDNKIKAREVTIATHRAQMVERLEWISSMNFAHDIFKWLEWREIRRNDRIYCA